METFAKNGHKFSGLKKELTAKYSEQSGVTKLAMELVGWYGSKAWSALPSDPNCSIKELSPDRDGTFRSFAAPPTSRRIATQIWKVNVL